MKKILWFEDDRDFVKPVKLFLEREDWEVFVAKSAEKGEKMVENVKIGKTYIWDSGFGWDFVKVIAERELEFDEINYSCEYLTGRFAGSVGLLDSWDLHEVNDDKVAQMTLHYEYSHKFNYKDIK